MASYNAFLGSAGFISMLSVSNPVLRLHLGCLRTCWIELSLQRELDFALLQELRFGPIFGYLLDPCLLPFRHQTHFRGSLGSSVGSHCAFICLLAALWHPQRITCSPSGHFLLAHGSRLLPLGSLFGDRVALICWVHSDCLMVSIHRLCHNSHSNLQDHSKGSF